jgi:glycosyltransferase involved in cell wall biosynthesis
VDGIIWFVTRVFPRVRAQVPDVRLKIVGRGATDEIVSLAESPGVEFLGYVEDLRPEMEGCALTLAAVRQGGGLRTKVLESFAYGRTAVVTPIGAAGIRGRDGVEFRIGTGESETAAAIAELLQNQEMRHAMEQAARQLVLAEYTIDLVAERSEAIYRELMG